MSTVLVTGGAGYIGSHTCNSLLARGDEVIVVDNLSNASKTALERVAALAGKAAVFIEGDLRDRALLDRTFSEHKIDAVVHFAGLKAVGESTKIPLAYYHNNLDASLALLDAMARHEVFNLVFSSSATVYGDTNPIPYQEHFPLSSTSPYGRTKVMIETFIDDAHSADPRWNAIKLRYFNPVGAHPSGSIGEDPRGIPNNLMPFITQVAVGKRAALSVFGDDYPTVDGTGVRDYLHVMDLADGHVKALDYLAKHPGGVEAINLGTGKGQSVLEVVAAFEAASQKPIPVEFAPRRAGDIAEFYADASKAQSLLGWQAQHTLADMCADSWRWQSTNPAGYP